MRWSRPALLLPIGCALALGAAAHPQGGRATVAADPSSWQDWWELRREAFLQTRRAIHHAEPLNGDAFCGFGAPDPAKDLRPSEEQIVLVAVPALLAALRDADGQRDIVSSSLLALAKIGRDPAQGPSILEVLRPWLRDGDPKIRASATLALGIAQRPAAIDDLLPIARDGADHRTRAFACYALGLIADADATLDSRRRVYEGLRTVLEATTTPPVDPDVPVAAIHGIRLAAPAPYGFEDDVRLHADCVATLWSCFTRAGPQPGEQTVQAHAVTALAHVIGRRGDLAGRYKRRFADLLHGKLGPDNSALQPSAALALGLLCVRGEQDQRDVPFSTALHHYSRTGKNARARNFALMALGQIGGARNRSRLLDTLRTGGEAPVKPWAALALGVLTFARDAGAEVAPDAGVGKALHRQFRAVKNEQTLAALALALGLCRWTDAADDLEALLVRDRPPDELAGYLALGLALMGNRRSLEPIHALTLRARDQPRLLRRASIALAVLGDKAATPGLHDLLDGAEIGLATRVAAATVIGVIGDRRSIDPLIRAMQDESLPPLIRSHAIAALGGAGDPALLPWHAKIADSVNNHTAVETLINGTDGVLDLR